MNQWWKKLERSRWAGPVSLACLLLLIAATGFRTYRQYAVPSREFDRADTGLSDFHNGIYFPSLAFRDRVVPYSQEAEERYPLARAAPPYHPVVFLIHQPFTWLSLPAADIAFFIFNVGLAIFLAALAIRLAGGSRTLFAWSAVTCLLLASRPGHITLFTGYFTLELVIGALVALNWAERKPWLAGVGLLVTAIKPNCLIPLLTLMLFRRNYRAIVWGVGFCLVVGLGCWAWLASASDFWAVARGFAEGQAALQEDPAEFPVNSWTRVDLLGLVAKWFDWRPSTGTSLLVMGGLLIWPGSWLWKRSFHLGAGRAETDFAGNLVILLSICCSIYNNSYDCLLLAAPAVGLMIYGQGRRSFPQWARIAMSGLLIVVAFNYLSTQVGQRFLPFAVGSTAWQILSSLNGICVAVALVIALASARELDDSEPSNKASFPEPD